MNHERYAYVQTRICRRVRRRMIRCCWMDVIGCWVAICSGLPDGDDDARSDLGLHDGRRAESTSQVGLPSSAGLLSSVPTRSSRPSAARRHRRPTRVRRRAAVEATRRIHRTALQCRQVHRRSQRFPDVDEGRSDGDEAAGVVVGVVFRQQRLFLKVPLVQ